MRAARSQGPARRVLVCLIGAALVAAIAGCSSGPGPEATVKAFFDALKAADFAAAARQLSYPGDTSLFPSGDAPEARLVKLVYSRFNYEIVSTERQGDQATVNVKLTMPDIGQVASQVISEIMPLVMNAALSGEPNPDLEAMASDMLEKAITDPAAPTTTTDMPIGLTKVEGQWRIGADAQFGAGMMENLRNIMNQAGQGGE